MWSVGDSFFVESLGRFDTLCVEQDLNEQISADGVIGMSIKG